MTCSEGIVQEFRTFMVTHKEQYYSRGSVFNCRRTWTGVELFQALSLLPMELPEERVYDNLFNSDRRTPH